MADEKKSKSEHKGLKIFLYVLLVVFLLLLTSVLTGYGIYWWQKGDKDDLKDKCEKNEAALMASVDNLKTELDQCEDERDDYENQLMDIEDVISGSDEESEIKEEDATVVADPCEFNKDVQLKKSSTYGIFGDDIFDTVVCGYAELKDEVVFDQTQTNLYFNITKFADEAFKNSLDQGITEGNLVNKKEGENYKFNLGCYKDGAIDGIQYDEGVDYVDQATQDAILGSTAENPVAVILSFGQHFGRGCQCCNLAHQIKLY